VRPLRYVRKLLIILLILAFTSSMLLITAEAGNLAYGAATVEASSLNIRSAPDTDSSIILTISHNEIIVILEQTSDAWYHINYHGTEGYVASQFLTSVVTAENFTATGKVTGDDVLMRSTPSTSGSLLGSCDAGTIVNLIGINNGWYKVKFGGDTGYIRSDYITIISDDTTSTAASSTQASNAQLSLRQQIINYALQYVGYDYVYGGTSPSDGFDCSGFVSYIFKHFDLDVTRTASSQYAQDGTRIAKAELLPGDLVFFSSNGGYSITHVGIYIGDNQFVHASSPKIGVVVSSLDSAYYTNVWYGAKRILPA
jgi:cell wall-associated NlpC family hydrolase